MGRSLTQMGGFIRWWNLVDVSDLRTCLGSLAKCSFLEDLKEIFL